MTSGISGTNRELMLLSALLLGWLALFGHAAHATKVIVLPGMFGSPIPTEPFSGSVLLSRDNQALINQWVGEPYRTWVRCYQLTTDTPTPSSTAFHAQCGNRGPSVVVISVNEKLFGGYTENSWSAGYGYRGYDKAFLYSLTEEKKYPLGHNYTHSTYSHISYGPTFGNGHDVYINSSMQLVYCNFPYAYAYDGSGPSQPTNLASLELCGVPQAQTTYNFSIDELEVWIHAEQ